MPVMRVVPPRFFKGTDSQIRKTVSTVVKGLILDIINFEKSEIHQYSEYFGRKVKPAEKQKQHSNLSQLEANMKLAKKTPKRAH